MGYRRCTICLKSIRKYWAKPAPCGHSLHFKCLSNYYNSCNSELPSCPECRQNIEYYSVVCKGIHRRFYTFALATESGDVTFDTDKEIMIDCKNKIEITTKTKPIAKPPIKINYTDNITKRQRQHRRRRQLKSFYKKINQYKKVRNRAPNPFLKKYHN